MHELGYISAEQFARAKETAIAIHRRVKVFAMPADYVAEMVRQIVYDRYREEAYTRGIKVYTTLRKTDQEAAYRALRKGVMEYDARHGYRGPEAFLKLPKDLKDREALQDIMQDIGNSDDILAAVVLSATPGAVEAFRKMAKPSGSQGMV